MVKQYRSGFDFYISKFAVLLYSFTLFLMYSYFSVSLAAFLFFRFFSSVFFFLVLVPSCYSFFFQNWFFLSSIFPFSMKHHHYCFESVFLYRLSSFIFIHYIINCLYKKIYNKLSLHHQFKKNPL